MPIVDYKDEITEEVFELFIKGEIVEEMVNPSTGNKAKRIYCSNKSTQI